MKSYIDNTIVDNLSILFKSGQPIVQLHTPEENRIMDYVWDIASAFKTDNIFEWSCTRGLRKVLADGTSNPIGGDELKNPDNFLKYIYDVTAKKIASRSSSKKEDKDYYIVKDFCPFYQSPIVVRRVRDIFSILINTMDKIILTTPILKVPPELTYEIAMVDFPYPKEEEIEKILENLLENSFDNENSKVVSKEEFKKMVPAAAGLTRYEIEGAFCTAIIKHHQKKKRKEKDVKDIFEYVLEQKANIVKKNGLLDYHLGDIKPEDVGGLENLKEWLQMRSIAYSKEAIEDGIVPPKGVLLIGMPGTGKSLCAKAAASILKVPLIKFDMGKVFGSLVGESESKMREAIKTIESIGSCVLMVDEMDKAFGGVNGSGSGDSGTTKRVFGSFLTWMQEKTCQTFIVATCNDASNFPPELLRKGRFDEIFHVDLPNFEERKNIFKIHIEKKKRNGNDYNLDSFAKESDKFTGAEIESCITNAHFRAYSQGRNFSNDDILWAIEKINPMATGMEDKLLSMKEFAKKNAINANISEEEGKTNESGKRGKIKI